MSNEQKRYRWGRSRFGGVPTMRIAIPVGVVLGMAYGVGHVVVNNPDGPLKWVAGLIYGAFMAPLVVALVAVLIVDRSTVKGAVKRPEVSIENHWYGRAATVAFHVTLVVVGIASLVATWAGQVVLSQVLAGVLVVLGGSFGVAYLFQKARS